MSKGEEKIISLLKKSQIRFEREKTFKDLKGGKYRFDFYVYVQGGPAVIECNGMQHYTQVKKFQPSRRDFNGQRERDRRKISYCLANQIPIYIIPYWELENITSAADLFNPRFRALTRWKNDVDYENFKRQNLTKH